MRLLVASYKLSLRGPWPPAPEFVPLLLTCAVLLLLAGDSGAKAGRLAPDSAGVVFSGGGRHDFLHQLPYLGRLAKDDYYYEPSERTLDAMYAADPDILAAVPNFTVGRRNFGTVRWLQPADVRGLNLESTVSIDHGAVSVYPSADDKPPQGARHKEQLIYAGVHRYGWNPSVIIGVGVIIGIDLICSMCVTKLYIAVAVRAALL